MESDRICPRCRWQCARVSKGHPFADRLLRRALLVRYRCRSCFHRFYRIEVPREYRMGIKRAGAWAAWTLNSFLRRSLRRSLNRVTTRHPL